MAIDQETRQRAEELYVIDGLTLEQVAAETGISERTIQNWSVEDGWPAKRREYKNAAAEIRRYTTLTKLKLIKDAMTSLDPQKVYAFSALERVTAKSFQDSPFVKGDTGSCSEKDTACAPDRQINTPQEAIEALKEAIDIKLRVMLGQPDALSLNAVKEFKQTMDLLDSMNAKYVPAGDGVSERKGLSDETVEDIKKRILGLK